MDKGGQELKEAVHAVAFHAATHQGGHFRLGEVQKFRGLCLVELSLLDEFVAHYPDHRDKIDHGIAENELFVQELSQRIPSRETEPKSIQQLPEIR